MTDIDRPTFLQAVARLAVALRESEPDIMHLRIYFAALQDLEIELITAAADRWMTSSSWFPKVSEWRGLARQIERERIEAQRARLRKLPAPLCKDCRDTGWRQCDDDRVTRCACATQRRLEVLRRVPPSLPDACEAPLNERESSPTVAIRE
jgi:hypothetical protein